MLATCSFRCVLEQAAVCWQPTSLFGLAGAGWWLYVGNLQVLWGVLGASFGLYVGNLQVLWGVLERVCTFYAGNIQVSCWSQFEAVCWQPTGLVGCVGTSLVPNVGNLQVLWVVLEPVWGCMLALWGA